MKHQGISQLPWKRDPKPTTVFATRLQSCTLRCQEFSLHHMSDFSISESRFFNLWATLNKTAYADYLKKAFLYKMDLPRLLSPETVLAIKELFGDFKRHLTQSRILDLFTYDSSKIRLKSIVESFLASKTQIWALFSPH